MSLEHSDGWKIVINEFAYRREYTRWCSRGDRYTATR